MEKEKILKLVKELSPTEDDMLTVVNYDDQPNEAFEAGWAWFRDELVKRIEVLD